MLVAVAPALVWWKVQPGVQDGNPVMTITAWQIATRKKIALASMYNIHRAPVTLEDIRRNVRENMDFG